MLSLIGSQQVWMAAVFDVAGTRPVGRQLNVVTVRRQFIQVELKIKIFLVRNKVEPAGKQTAQIEGFSSADR